MPIKPGQKVKIKDTFPHRVDGEPFEAAFADDKALRGKTGVIDRNDQMYGNYVTLDEPTSEGTDWGCFYDHELEVI